MLSVSSFLLLTLSILAARFLNRFIDEHSAWVHVDLAACNHKGGLAHVPTDVTSFGVRFSLELLTRTNVFDHLQAKHTMDIAR